MLKEIKIIIDNEYHANLILKKAIMLGYNVPYGMMKHLPNVKAYFLDPNTEVRWTDDLELYYSASESYEEMDVKSFIDYEEV